MRDERSLSAKPASSIETASSPFGEKLSRIACAKCGGKPALQVDSNVCTLEKVFTLICHGESESFEVADELFEGFDRLAVVDYVAFSPKILSSPHMPSESQSRMARRRAEYLNRQTEEAERAAARRKLEQAEAFFAQERRRLCRPTLKQNLGESLEAELGKL